MLRGANPGAVGVQSGRRSIEIYFDSVDPFHPQEFTDDAINNVLVILAGLAVIGVAVWHLHRIRREILDQSPKAHHGNRAAIGD